MAKKPGHKQAWFALARDSFAAANVLMRSGHWRSSASRSYYAAFAAVVGALPENVPKPRNQRTPRHQDLPQMVLTYLAGLPMKQRREVKASLEKMYRSRIDADYYERLTTDRVIARQCVTQAGIVINRLKG